MSIVTRANKAGSGTPNYFPDTLIESAEVNLDFNTLYDDYDGNITGANIAANANIPGSALAVLSVTSLQLAADSVITTKIQDGAVTTDKLDQNATTPAFATANANPSLTIIEVEQTVVTLAAVTTRGGRVLLTGTIAMVYRQARNVAVTAILKIKQNGVAVTEFDYALVTADLAETALTTAPIPTPTLLFTP